MLIALGYAIQLLGLGVIVLATWLPKVAAGFTVTTRFKVIISTKRMLIGAAMAWVAPSTKFPLVILILGILAIAASAATLLISNSRLQSIVNWYLDRPNAIRAGGVIALLFGGFLLHAK